MRCDCCYLAGLLPALELVIITLMGTASRLRMRQMWRASSTWVGLYWHPERTSQIGIGLFKF